MNTLFNKTWKRLMLLWESPVSFNPFTDIPKKELGISTSVKDLPDTKPYGFWVDRHGNFVAVRTHGPAAEDIRSRMGEWMSEKKIPLPNGFYTSGGYTFLLKNGWMRVVSEYSFAIYIETRGDTSSGQTKFLEFIRDLYFTPETPIEED